MTREILPADYVVFTSYGNDSVALIHWVKTHGLKNVALVYSDTGWADPWWTKRVGRLEKWAQENGFATYRTFSLGMMDLVRKKKGWPMNGKQFCTEHLKIKPALAMLDQLDPEREAICLAGVRREESRARASWPEWIEESERHAGRTLWCPLVRHSTEQRDKLLVDAGITPLPHRSQECYPCINANKADLRMIREDRIEMIEQFEEELGYTSKGKPRTMFRPANKMGATGIREVIRWAHTEHGKFNQRVDNCDSGFCWD